MVCHTPNLEIIISKQRTARFEEEQMAMAIPWKRSTVVPRLEESTIAGLVNMQKAMENYHFQRVNPLFLWPFSSSQTVSLPGRVNPRADTIPAAVLFRIPPNPWTQVVTGHRLRSAWWIGIPVWRYGTGPNVHVYYTHRNMYMYVYTFFCLCIYIYIQYICISISI